MPRIEFSEEKNVILKATRGVGFEEVIDAINSGKIINNIKHHQQKYPNQRILVVKIKNYAYAAPFVYDKNQGVLFLKTVYPSRILTKRYLRK